MEIMNISYDNPVNYASVHCAMTCMIVASEVAFDAFASRAVLWIGALQLEASAMH